MNIFTAIKSSLRLYSAICKADNAHKETGERYYVMPTPGITGNLLIMDRENFRGLKHKKYVSSKANVSDLQRECFYCTPYRNGDEALPALIQKMKRDEYMSWIKSIDEKKIEQRKARRAERKNKDKE